MNAKMIIPKGLLYYVGVDSHCGDKAIVANRMILSEIKNQG